MLDLKYFKDQICDELRGAKCYIKLAIETKTSNPMWSKAFVDMSATELGHATNLYKMFEEYYQKVGSSYSVIPDYLKECYDEAVQMYTEKFAKVRYMHDLYNK